MTIGKTMVELTGRQGASSAPNSQSLNFTDMATFYTVPQVAEMMNVSADHIYRVTSSGELGSYKIGRNVRISQDQIDRWLRTKRQYTKYERREIADTHVATH